MDVSLEYREKYFSRINQALNLIHQKLASDITLEELAEAACFSAFHFHRIFKAITGETPKDYIERLRLEKAANQLLHQSNTSITDIAMECGFSSPSVFARSFKNHFHLRAKDFRKSHDRIRALEGIIPPIVHKLTADRPDNFALEIKRLPGYHVAFARSLEGYSRGIEKAWNRLFRWANVRDIINADTRMIGIPWDNPGVTPQDRCRYDACITVPPGTKPHGEFGITDIPGGKYAIYHFQGKPADIAPAYLKIYGSWLPNSGYVPDDRPGLEIYLEIPDNCPDPVLRYDMCIPVRPL